MNRILLRAADLLEDGKLGPQWCQGAYKEPDEHGRPMFCAIGAILHVVHPTNEAEIDSFNLEDYPDEQELLGEAIVRLGSWLDVSGEYEIDDVEDPDHVIHDVINWNDHHAQTAEDVIRVFRAAGNGTSHQKL